MIILSQRKILLGEKKEHILKFDVWWVTQAGLVVKLEDAVALCRSNGWDELSIRPVPVAVGETIYELLG